MTTRVRLTIAAVLTALFLAAIGAAGLLSQTHIRLPPPISVHAAPVQPPSPTIHYEEHD